MAVRSEAWSGNRFLLASATRRRSIEGNPVELLTTTLEDLASTVKPPSTPFEVLDKLLILIHDRTDTVLGGAWIPLSDYPLFTLRSEEELKALCQQLDSMGLIRVSASPGRMSCTLTLDGWTRVGELTRTGQLAKQVFVAMSFADEINDVWSEAIKPAIEQCGFSPVRVDKIEHNEKICDRIVAEIRRSGFVVADFTGNRAGVYFEAGYASGLGIPVIYTVAAAEIDDVHFDTRQYNHIAWIDKADLKQKLEHRIAATIGYFGAV